MELDIRSWHTLVDLVDAALGAIGDAVNAVKNAATSFVNGIKAGLSFIGDAVLKIIFDILSFTLNLFTKASASIFASLIPGVSTNFINLNELELIINGNPCILE